MTSNVQRQKLQQQIWNIACHVRGAVDGWDFKQYVLGTLFYRFISENFASYMEADTEIDYAAMSDIAITPEIKLDAIKTKGIFIYPSQLFCNVAQSAATRDNLNTELSHILQSIEKSSRGGPSEQDIVGLFADFDTTSSRLGNTVKDKNARLASVIDGVASLQFGSGFHQHMDLFGDAYEFLVSNYAANAGKSGGEFFTPSNVSLLLTRIVCCGKKIINKVYDPACGSGSLLLQAKKFIGLDKVEGGFYGQEINNTTYNLARMNMLLHNVNYDKFEIRLGDTLLEPHFMGEKFDAIVSNPPYSIKWKGDSDPTLINDERFAPAGKLAPKSKADFAFVMHVLHYLSATGRAAIVCFPGIFYRGGAEQTIRKYLVDGNYVESIIALPPNLFYGTTITTVILVLAKNKTTDAVQFIDATGADFYSKKTNNNIIEAGHMDKILKIFANKSEIAHVARMVPHREIIENDYNLSPNTYIEPVDTREQIDIRELNRNIERTVKRINELRNSIDKIILEIES